MVLKTTMADQILEEILIIGYISIYHMNCILDLRGYDNSVIGAKLQLIVVKKSTRGKADTKKGVSII